ncbi:hypothetical protein HMPREF1557_00281 [Streptococcus sobrinus W1703]|uniref:Uncharacterized protein n=1 Tax=Streptococcus sobrinus W1703 TaxID=1227275 RepID=U2KUG4_9STRE|nr:hypothetical protein HMPREF1557_00281 [Streptococcus sobrinus W1703]
MQTKILQILICSVGGRLWLSNFMNLVFPFNFWSLTTFGLSFPL